MVSKLKTTLDYGNTFFLNLPMGLLTSVVLKFIRAWGHLLLITYNHWSLNICIVLVSLTAVDYPSQSLF